MKRKPEPEWIGPASCLTYEFIKRLTAPKPTLIQRILNLFKP